jgi:hypothetical protein
MNKARKLYESQNGDRWYLIRTAGEVLVRHEANAASGGHVEHLSLGAFLSRGQGPEHQELTRLIGTLLDEGTRSTEWTQPSSGKDPVSGTS